jgi:hypothetical protein
MRIYKLLLFAFLWFNLSAVCFAQYDDEEAAMKLLNQIVENPNPTYRPVVGVGVGMFNFYGEVHDKLRSPVTGNPGVKVNVATFIDNSHYFRGNVFVMLGSVSANERSFSDTAANRNFSSDIMSFGFNVHYDFQHIKFFRKSAFKPFVSLGLEDFTFNTKTDIFDANGDRYFYWSDGTIRNISEKYKNIMPSKMLQRDYKYETDVQQLNNASYSQNSIAIPLEVGIDFAINDRINLRVGQSWHFAFTDNIGKVSTATSSHKKDMFTFTYFTVHFDLFSDAKSKRVEKMAAEMGEGFDNLLFEDEDDDGVRDLIDKCPGTPRLVPAVEVDSVGCPLDNDNDGVPNYLDKESNTPSGAMVDESGVQIKPDDMAAKLNIDAINRKEVEAFLLMYRAQSRYKGKSQIPIPAKFKPVDTDADGYISFDELLKAMNEYFDFSSNLNAKDIGELQDFFFEQ